MLRRPVEFTQYLSLRYSQRLADNDIVASVGSKGDSYDNSLVESFNGLYKWELIYPQGPWTGLEDVEFATLTYVDWFNQRRLHGGIAPGPGYTTPANYEADYYRQNVPAEPAGEISPNLVDGGWVFRRRPLIRRCSFRCGFRL